MRDNGNPASRITSTVLRLLVIFFIGAAASITYANPAITKQSTGFAPHTVKAGETLYRISTTRGFTVDEVAVYNNLKPPYTLSIGQVLSFPGAASQREEQRTVPPVAAAKPKPVPTPVAKPVAQPVVTTQAPAKAVAVKRTEPKPQTNAAIRAESGWQWPVNAKPIQDFGVSKRGYSYVLDDATQIVAATSGRVIYAKQGLGSYRHIVITTTPEGYVIAYEFNSDIQVEENSQVEKGQVIATISKPKNESAPRADAYSKFYFEVWKNGATINPKDVIKG